MWLLWQQQLYNLKQLYAGGHAATMLSGIHNFFFSRARCAALANHPQHKTASTMAAATVQHKATVQYGAAIKYSVASRVGSSKLNGWGLFYGTE